MRYAVPLVLLVALLHEARVTRSAGMDQAPRAAQAATAQRERAYRANNLGVAYLEQFNYQNAERAFREALKLQPDLAIARLNLAIALFYAGRSTEAAAEARAAVKAMPDLPQAHYVSGLIEKAENRLDEAVAAFTRVLQLDPADAGARIQLGQIHLQKREYQEAARLLQEALIAEPYNVTAAYSLALTLTRAGQAEEGRRAMQRFETLRDSAYGVTYSQTYLGQGRYGEALASTGAEADLVNAATPAVTFSETDRESLPASGGLPGPRGGVTLFDADGDGDLDLVDTGRGATRFFRNAGGRFADESTRAGLGELRDGAGVVAGDFDNDGRPDLFVLRESGSRLLHATASAAFEDVTDRAGLSVLASAPTAAAFADVDHDGDLDIVVAGSAVQLLRNNGDVTFSDITAAAGLAGPLETAVAVAAADFDAHRDIDLLVAGAGRRAMLYRNMRDGTFRDSASDFGLPEAICTAIAVSDVNKDGYPDLFLARRNQTAVFALSDGHGRFRSQTAPDGSQGALAAQFVDYDNDGLVDLMTMFDRRLRLFRNLGASGWSEVSDAAKLPGRTAEGPVTSQSMALGDLDSDGDTDVVVRDTNGRLRMWKNDGGNRNASVRVRLAARVSNRSAIGAKVEMRAGSLRQMLDTSSSTPAVAPADLVFGLGTRAAADVVRVLWPSGILQAETALDAAAPKAVPRAAITVTELDRKPSSCPYLFTWNGSRFEFVTDFMGGGEMGGWLGPALWSQPDPDEYVRIRSDQLQPRDGRYEIRMTNELEEAVFFDRVQLVAVDHARDVEVFPNEGLRSPPHPGFELISIRGARPPARPVDEHGHDVLPQISSLDRRSPDDFHVRPIRGYADAHELTLDLGQVSPHAVLLLTGWTDYAFSSDNVAASQSGLTMHPPSLQVRDAHGAWRTVIADMGFPVGRPQTIAVELTGKFLSASREVRILTNMRIYWDQILVGSAPARGPLGLTRLDPVSAHLRWRGVSAEVTPDGRAPFSYNYQQVSTTVPWKAVVGRYTREGDVRPLLRRLDDLFVISRPGDEVALSFDALPPPAAGRARTFLLYVHGYSKEMNPRSATPDTVGPLPFRAMTSYPYGAGEHYPRTKRHREYQERYNTRIVQRSLPSIDAPAPAPGGADGGQTGVRPGSDPRHTPIRGGIR